jgi:hypothetical protein
VGYGEGYREEWTNLQLPDGTTRAKRRDAAVGRRALNPVLADADLYGEYPDLGRELGTSITSWQTFIDEAWKTIMHRLRQQGAVPQLIISDYDLRPVHKHLTLYLVFKWFHRSAGASSTWLDLMEAHRRDYEAAYSSMNVVVDADEDGVADGGGREGTYAQVSINPAPRRTLAPSRWW